MTAVLELDGLDIFAPGPAGPRPLVLGSTLSVGRGEAVGLVGESGSGKTLTVRAVAGLLPDGFTTGGTIRIQGQDVADLGSRELRELRARRLGMTSAASTRCSRRPATSTSSTAWGSARTPRPRPPPACKPPRPVSTRPPDRPAACCPGCPVTAA